MTLVEDFGLNLSSRKLILLALSIPDKKNEKKMDILHINKIIKLYQESLDKNDIEFTNFNLGAVSYEIEESISILEEIGLIDKISNKYSLTEIGDDAVYYIKKNMNENEIKTMKYSKELLNDLSFEELLFYMYMRFPKTREYSSQIKKLSIMKKGLISNLRSSGKIDEETANEWLILEI